MHNWRGRQTKGLTVIQCLRHALSATRLEHSFRQKISAVQKCTNSNLHSDLSFLYNDRHIQTSEFISRCESLTTALTEASVEAFDIKPGYTFRHHANISQADWEPWEPEKWPFLTIVRPVIDQACGYSTARTMFLAPHSEEGHVRLLGYAILQGREARDYDMRGTLEPLRDIEVRDI